MITEKKFSIKDLVTVASGIVMEQRTCRVRADMYLLLFNKEVGDCPDLLSPLAELYQTMLNDAVYRHVQLERRFKQLQAIADSTLLPDLDF